VIGAAGDEVGRGLSMSPLSRLGHRAVTPGQDSPGSPERRVDTDGCEHCAFCRQFGRVVVAAPSWNETATVESHEHGSICWAGPADRRGVHVEIEAVLGQATGGVNSDEGWARWARI
jgi:hypothetical protein